MTEPPPLQPDPSTWPPKSSRPGGGISFRHKCVTDDGEKAYADLFELLPFFREDVDNVVFRRFQNLHLLYLLALQHQLKHHVEELQQQYDRRLNKIPSLEVLDGVGPLLKEYDEAMSAYERMQRRLSTPAYALKSIKGGAKFKGELACLDKEMGPGDEGWDDLISLQASADKGAIHQFIDSTESLTSLKRLLRKRSPRGKAKSDLERTASKPQFPMLSKAPGYHFYYSERAVRVIEQIIIGTLMCSLILIPIAVLSSITNQNLRILAIILSVVFVWPFSMLLARPSDTTNMTMMLTYATIVVVFVSNNQDNKN